MSEQRKAPDFYIRNREAAKGAAVLEFPQLYANGVARQEEPSSGGLSIDEGTASQAQFEDRTAQTQDQRAELMATRGLELLQNAEPFAALPYLLEASRMVAQHCVDASAAVVRP